MKQKRKLARNVWYEVRTAINVGEPLFRLPWAVVLLYRVLLETKGLYPFEIRGLELDEAWLTFYIKPADGFQLPKIMQWLKQTFSARFNVITGRTGHLWGERYESWILAGEPPERVKEADWATVKTTAEMPIPVDTTYTLTWDNPRSPGITLKAEISVKNAPKPASPPG
ncbi:MAG: hypothetical protein LBG27_07375 [Spirochaetaceae bacterium]|jgi:hypothetical protein|nr:hypothetical protein [Spirochaetaceae bacterium]